MNGNLKIQSDGSEMKELRGILMDEKCGKCGGIHLGAEESGIPGQCRCSVESSPCCPSVYCEADLKKGRSIKAEQGAGVFSFALKDGRKTRKIELTDDEAWVIGEMISAMHPRTLGSSNPLWHRIQEQRQIILDNAKPILAASKP